VARNRGPTTRLASLANRGRVKWLVHWSILRGVNARGCRVGILVTGLLAILYAAISLAGMRVTGGWMHVRSIKHGHAGSEAPEWDDLAGSIRVWYFAVPAFLAYGVVAAVVGLVQILTTS
jgi:hypothetical protein